MKYLCLIYGDESMVGHLSPADLGKMRDQYMAYTADLKSSGSWLGGNALQPTSTATTVRVREGKTLTSDGPFAETKEQLGGYYLVEAADLNAALQVAARIPGAAHGAVEVRPIREMPGT